MDMIFEWVWYFFSCLLGSDLSFGCPTFGS